mgnify:CR=1 FL=1
MLNNTNYKYLGGILKKFWNINILLRQSQN